MEQLLLIYIGLGNEGCLFLSNFKHKDNRSSLCTQLWLYINFPVPFSQYLLPSKCSHIIYMEEQGGLLWLHILKFARMM